MRRFILSMLMLAVVAIAAVVVRVTYRIYLHKTITDRVYELKTGEDIIFIGSSQTACSISTNACFHNKVFWMTASAPEFSLMRLLELERRKQLESVKVCFCDFAFNAFHQQRNEKLALAWARELPISWRYLSCLPSGCYWSLLKTLYERPEMRFSIGDLRTPNKPSVSTRPAGWIELLPSKAGWLDIFDEKTYSQRIDFSNGWEDALKHSIFRMKEVCERNGIRFVLWAPPLPSFCKRIIPHGAEKLWDDYVASFVKAGVEFVDFRNSMPDDNDFFDHFHFECVHDVDARFTEMLYNRMKLSAKTKD